MSDKNKLQYGSIEENDDVVIYEIPKEQTNLLETEQLDELKRTDQSFFDCQHYVVDDTFIRIYYKRDKSFKKLSDFKTADEKLRRRIGSNLLTIEKLIGTQYTTLIHPDNIYVNDNGDVKYAHRGIRSVLPPEEFTSLQLINDLKMLLLYLFTTLALPEIRNMDMERSESKDPIIRSICSASSINQLQHFLQNKQFHSNNNRDTNAQSKNKKQEKPTANKQKKPNQKLSLMSGLLIGLLIGMLILYAAKVVPLTKASTAVGKEHNEQQEVLTDKNKELQAMLDDNRTVMNAYRAVVIGDTEEAIKLFEGVKTLDESAKRTMIEQYIKLNTLESLVKAAKLSDVYHVKVVQGLVGLNSKEANEEILGIKSDKPEIKVEQAWIKKEHEDVIEQSKSINDNKRAKLLAAKSYIELGNTKEAMKLAKELKNKDLQIASLKKDIEKVKDDKKMKKDDKKDKTKDLQDKIKKLEK